MQHDYEITTDDAKTGKQFRAAVNTALQSLASNNAGGNAPSVTYGGQFWYDTENDMLWIRNATNTAWIAVGTVSAGIFPVANKYADDIGTQNGYMISLTPTPTSHVAGMPISFKAASTNTGSSTITINSLTTKTIKKNGSSNLEAGDIQSGVIVTVVYDGANYQLVAGPMICSSDVSNAISSHNSNASAHEAIRNEIDSDISTHNSDTSAHTAIQKVKAWVLFDGTETVSIRGSFNVSSITDNGVGYYTVNFTNAMPDANYCLMGSARGPTYSGVYNPIAMVAMRSGSTPSTTNCQISVEIDSSAAESYFTHYDSAYVSVAFLR